MKVVAGLPPIIGPVTRARLATLFDRCGVLGSCQAAGAVARRCPNTAKGYGVEQGRPHVRARRAGGTGRRGAQGDLPRLLEAVQRHRAAAIARVPSSDMHHVRVLAAVPAGVWRV